MSKQHRPIDQYDAQFEDKEVEQSETIREEIDFPELPSAEDMIASNVQKAVFTEESTEGISKEAYESVLTPQDRYLANIEESGVLEGLTGEDNTSIDNPADVDVLNPSLNWWNTFYNMIDEIDAERYKGQILEAETKIDHINEKIQTQQDSLNDQEIAGLLEERDEWKTVIEEKRVDLIENQNQIDRQKVAESYKNYTDAMASQEGSTFQSYAGHLSPFGSPYATSGEMAKDLGGAFSDIWSMAVSIAAPIATQAAGNAIIASGLAAGTSGAAAGTPTGPGALVVGGVSFLAGAGISYAAQYNARENESYAEMYGAYEERLRDMEKMFKLENHREPTEKEHKQMKKDARKGAESVLNHNMGLYMYDMAEAGLTLVPWAKNIKWLASTNRWKKHLTQVGMVGAGSFLGAINEAREEGDQYLIKNDYIKGVYDNDDVEKLGLMARGGSMGVIGTLAKAAEGISDRGLGYSAETLGALPKVLLPGWSDQIANYAPGRTNTAEFRNSVRSGFAMGILMGGGVGAAQSIWGAASRERDRYVYGNTLEEINPFLAEYLNDEQTRSKAYQYFQNFSDGKFNRMYKAIKNMDKMDLRTDEGVNIEKELRTLEEHKALYDMITGMEEYASLDNKEASDLFYTVIKMKSKAQGALEQQSEMTSSLADEYEKLDTEGKPDGYSNLLAAKHKAQALNKLIQEYENLNFKDNPNLSDNDRKLWERKREFSLNYFKGELKKANQAIAEGKEATGIKDLRSLGKNENLENRAHSLQQQQVQAAYYSRDYAELMNPMNGPLMRSNLRFKETQEYRAKGEKTIENETVGTAEVMQAVPKEDQQLKPGITVRATDADGVIRKGVISEDGKSILFDGDKEQSRLLSEMDGWTITPVESASEVVENAANTKQKNEAKSQASNNSAENEVTTNEVNDQPGESENTTNNNNDKSEEEEVIDLTDSQIQAEEDDFGVSMPATPQTDEQQEEAQQEDNSEPTEEEKQGQDPKEEPTDEELARSNPQAVYRFMRNGMNQVHQVFSHVAKWVKKMTTEKMRNYTVSYNLNMEYIDKVVKKVIKMNTGTNKKLKYSFIEKIQPLLKDLADPNKPIDVKAWTERRDGNGNPNPKGEFSFIGFLPINATVLDSSGKVVRENGKSVVFSIHNNNWMGDIKNPGNLHPQELSLLNIKEEFLKNLSQGKKTYGLIQAKGKGLLNTKRGAKNAVSSLFQDQPVRIGITKNGMIYQSNNIPLAVLTNEESLQSRTGGLYAVITLPDGSQQSIQLGLKNEKGQFQLPNRTLTQKEVDVLYDIAKRIAISKVGSPTAFDLNSTYNEEGFENLSADNILYLLLGTANYRQGFANFKGLYNKKNPGITINGQFISKQALLSKEGAVTFKTQAKSLRRNVHVQGLETGKNVTDLPGIEEKGTGITFFGETFEKGNSDYLTTFLKVDKTPKEGAILSTDVDTSGGSLFQPAPVFLSNTVSSTWPGRIDSTFTSKGEVKLPRNIEAIVSELKNKSKRFVLSEDETQYIEYETEEHKVVVARYDRVTSFTDKKGPDPSILLTNAQNIGTAMDGVVRDFFAGKLKKWNEYKTAVKVDGKLVYSTETLFKSKELFDEFKKDLIQLSLDFEKNGEYVVSEDIILSDRSLGLAGTVDILTITAEGEVRIYDMKTKRSPFVRLEKPFKDSKSYIAKWTDQLSLYRILLNNVEGLRAAGIGIIPIRVSYSDKVEDNQTSVASIPRGSQSPWSGDDLNRPFMIELTPLDEIKESKGKRVAKLSDKPADTGQTYRGLPVIETEDIINAEGKKGAAQYDRKNKLIKVNKKLLKKKFKEKAWTKMRKLNDGSKAQPLPKDAFKTYEEFEAFVIEHEYQHSLLSEEEFKTTQAWDTDKGDYETEINRRALEALKSEDETKTFIDKVKAAAEKYGEVIASVTKVRTPKEAVADLLEFLEKELDIELSFEKYDKNEGSFTFIDKTTNLPFKVPGSVSSRGNPTADGKSLILLDIDYKELLETWLGHTQNIDTSNPVAEEDQQNAQDLSDQDDEAVYEMAVDSVEAPEALIDTDEEVAWIKRVLGNAVPVEVVNDIIKVGKNGGSLAYAIFHRSMITLSKRAPKGAGFHEAYHAVEELYLTPEEINQLNEETFKDYGKPDQLEISRVMRKWASAFNISLTEQEAINIIYSERRAEDFRVYQLTRGDRKSASSLANRFFKRILDWIKNIFSNELTANVLFDRIEKGYYAQRPPLSSKQQQWYNSQVQMTMEIPGFSQTQIENITNSLLYYAIIGNSTGGFNRVDTTKKVRIDTGLTKATLLKTLEGAKARELASKTADQTRIANLQKVIDNIDFFIDNAKLELKKIGLREAQAAKDQNDVAQSLGDSNKDLEAATKASFESSNKDNATTNTRLILSFLPKKVESKKTPGKYITVLDKTTGLPLIANPSYVWNTTESVLTGIVDYYNEKGVRVGAMEQMVEALKTYGTEVDPTFLGLVDILGTLAPGKKSAFHNAFSKTEHEFLTTLYSIAGEGEGRNFKFTFFDSNVQNKANRIYNSWKSNFSQLGILVPVKQKDGNYVYMVDRNKLDELLAKHKDFEQNTLLPLFKGSPLTDIDLGNFINLLNEVGIYIDLKGLKVAIEVKKKDIQALNPTITREMAFLTLANDILGMFTAKPLKKNGKEDYKNRFLFKWLEKYDDTTLTGLKNATGAKKDERLKKIEELRLAGMTPDTERNNPIGNFKGILKPLAEAQAVFDQEFGQNTILGPEGRTYWIYAPYNYITKWVAELKKSAFNSAGLAGSIFHQRSYWLFNLSDLHKDPDGTVKPLGPNKNTENFGISTFNNMKQQGGEDQGKRNIDVTPADEHSLRVNQVLNNIYSPPSFADKSVWYLYSGMNEQTMNMFPTKFDFDEHGRIIISEKALRIFGNYFADEWDRIQVADTNLFGKRVNGVRTSTGRLEDNELIEFYHYKIDDDGNFIREDANALQFSLFPSFNSNEIREELGLTKNGNIVKTPLTNNQKLAIQDKLQEILRGRIQEEIDLAVKNGVLKRNASGFLVNGSLDGVKYIEYTERFASQFPTIEERQNAAAQNIMAQYALGSMISNVESMKLFLGDPAFYKTMNDMLKRTPAIIAPGQQLNVTEGHVTYNAAVVRDVETKSPYLQTYIEAFRKYYKEVSKTNPELAKTDEEIDKILDPYANYSETDAQGYITLQRWRFLMEGLGKWNEGWNDAYDRLSEGKGTDRDMELINAQPLKGMHFELRKHLINNNKLAVPTYFKYSQAVLIPQLVLDAKGEPKNELGKVLKAMEEKQIDELIFDSGVKVGAQSPAQLLTGKETSVIKNPDDLNLVPILLQNKYWKLQQDLPPHTSPTQLEGSQVKRNILSNIKQDKMYKLDGKEITGEELIRKVHEVDSILSDLGKEQLFNEFGIEEEFIDGLKVYKMKNKEKLQKSLIENFSTKESTSENLLKSLELTDDKTEFIDGLDENQFWREIDSILASMVTKRTVKLEMPGGSYIQMSGFGMQKVTKYTDLSQELRDKIQFVSPGERELAPPVYKDGKFQSGGILIPSWFKSLLPREGMDGKEIYQYLKSNKLLNAVGYRIPNQGMSSIDSLRVVGFLPSAMGDTVVAYNEITAKTGSDFDIDKMYIMHPNYKKVEMGTRVDSDGNTVKEYRPVYIPFKAKDEYNIRDIKMLQNRKLELYQAILKSEHTFVELVTPLDSIDIKNRAATVRYLENKRNLSKEAIKEIEGASEKKFASVVDKHVTPKEDLKYVSPAYQMEIRRTFMGGKFGVAQTARQLVDVPISQWTTDPQILESPYYFPNIYLGVGHSTTENHSDLSRIYSTDGVLITGTLSARLNAYVDIAKDPYIFYLNNNTVTANTVFMLDRLGVPPNWTDYFMSQPILKEYVDKSFYNGAGTTDVSPFTSVYGELAKEYRSKYLQTLDEKINKQRTKEGKPLLSLPKDRTGDIAFYFDGNFDTKYQVDIPAKDYTEGERKMIKDAFYKVSPSYLLDQDRTASISEEIEVDELLKMIEGDLSNEDFFAGQLKILNLYEVWQGYAKTLSEGITASKSDVNGANGGIIGSSVELERIRDVRDAELLAGFWERFFDTMLGAYRMNGPQLYKALSNDIFKFSYAFQGYQTAIRGADPTTLGGILYYSNVSNTYDEDILNQIYRDLKAIVYARQKGNDVTLYKTPEQVEELFYGERGLVNRLNEYKNNPNLGLSNNFFLQYLDVELPKTAKVWVPGDHQIRGSYKNIGIEPGYIKAQKTSYKSGSDKNKLTRGWQELLNHSDPEIRKFGMELYEASFLMSGFGSTLYSFHELFPVETRRAAGINQYLMQENVQISNNALYFLPSDLAIFYKNNWTNKKLVPELGPRAIIKDRKPVLTTIKGKKVNINKIVENQTGRPLFFKVKSENYKIEDDQFVPYVTIRNAKNGELELYEFIGLDHDDQGVYAITEKLGYSKGGKHIKEFSTDRTGLAINKLDAVSEAFTTSKREELYKIAGVDLKYETPFGIENLIEDRTLRENVNVELGNKASQELEGGERMVSFEVVEEAPKETGDKVIPFTIVGEEETTQEVSQEPVTSYEQAAREKRFMEQYNDVIFLSNSKRQIEILAEETNENFWDVAEAVYLAMMNAVVAREAANGLLGSANDRWDTIIDAVRQKEGTLPIEIDDTAEVIDRRSQYYYEALYNVKNKKDKIDEGYSWFQTPAATFKGYSKADVKLDNKLKEFLSKAGFKVEEDTLANIKRKYGIGAIGVADILNRMITIAKEERNISTLPEESAHIIVEMLVGKNEVVDNLLVKIEGWSKFDSVYNEYAPIYRNPNGSINMGRIRKEAVGKLIAEVMVQNWNIKQNNWFYTQVRKLLNFVMNAMKGWKYFELYQEASAIADTLIEDNSKTVVSPENTKPVSSSLVNWVNLVQTKLDSVLEREDQSLSLLDATPLEQSIILEEPDPTDSVFFQANARNIYMAAKEELAKARNSSGTRLFSFGIQDRAMASPNIKRFVEQRNFVNNLNRTKFNGTQVVQLVKNPYNPTKQVWVIRPNNYKGPQLGLFEQENRMNPEKKCD